MFDAEDAIAVARGDGGVTRPAGRNIPTIRTSEIPHKGGQAKGKGGRGSDPPEGSGRTDAPTQGWKGRDVDGGGVVRAPAKRTTVARLLHTWLDASTRRAHASHIRPRQTRHPRVRGFRWAQRVRWARPAHTSGGEWPLAGRTACAPPPSQTRGNEGTRGGTPEADCASGTRRHTERLATQQHAAPPRVSS